MKGRGQERRGGGVKEGVNLRLGWFDSKNNLRQQADRPTVHDNKPSRI